MESAVGTAGDATRAQILLAAVSQCEEVGLRRLTMEDVARRAGLGRATLYRYFQSKDTLVQAVVLAEAETFFTALDGALADCASDEERVVEGFAFAVHYVRAHALLAKLLRSEPETLLPPLMSGQLIALATEEVCRRVHEESSHSRHARETAEVLVRLVLSLALTPESGLGVEDREGALRFARERLVPSLRAR